RYVLHTIRTGCEGGDGKLGRGWKIQSRQADLGTSSLVVGCERNGSSEAPKPVRRAADRVRPALCGGPVPGPDARETGQRAVGSVECAFAFTRQRRLYRR